MKKEFNEILETYLLDKSKKTNKDSRIHNLIINILPDQINNSIVYHKDNYHVSGSYGQGNKSEYPWIMISNKQITKSAQKGLYLVYLFRSDMKGFYLSLNQGITYYENSFGKDSFSNAQKVSSYFRELLNTEQYLSRIELISKKNKLARGYEASNIIAKYYDLENFTEMQLSQDLNKMIDLYNQIFKNWIFKSYDELVSNVISNLIKVTKVGDDATSALIESAGEQSQGFIISFDLEKEHAPTPRHKVNKAISILPVSKKDYAKSQRVNAETGKLGELIVFEHEKKLLSNYKIDKHVEWVSVEDDNLGYDILSYDLKDGKVLKKYIEVKTTKSGKYEPFYISKNEMDKFKSNDNFVIYRVYDIDKNNHKAKFYEIKSLDENTFDVSPKDYIVKIK
jgi:hypothetical protein